MFEEHVATPALIVTAEQLVIGVHVEPFGDDSKSTVPVASDWFNVAVIVTAVPTTCGEPGDVARTSELVIVGVADAGVDARNDNPMTTTSESIPVPIRVVGFARTRRRWAVLVIGCLIVVNSPSQMRHTLSFEVYEDDLINPCS
jgi:hypothetical protein